MRSKRTAPSGRGRQFLQTASSKQAASAKQVMSAKRAASASGKDASFRWDASPGRGAALGRIDVAEEVKANLRAWFERNFMNQRAGRIGDISYTRAGELDDRPGDALWYFAAYERALIDHIEPLRMDEFLFLVHNPLIAFQIALGVTDLRGLRCLRRGLTERVNRLQARIYRSRYYPQENARRRALAAERRRITRRTTFNPCPTPEVFREAFAHRADSADARIRFGGLVHDLECYVDNCLRFDTRGDIVGRNGGIRAWIVKNVPELACRYKTIMRYKALAKRIRQLTGIADPVPTDALLPSNEATSAVQMPTDALLSPNGTPSAHRETPHREATIPLAKRRENYSAVNSHCPNGVDVRLHVQPPNGTVNKWTEREVDESVVERSGREEAPAPIRVGRGRLERSIAAGSNWLAGNGRLEQIVAKGRICLSQVIDGSTNTFAGLMRSVDLALTESDRSVSS